MPTITTQHFIAGSHSRLGQAQFQGFNPKTKTATPWTFTEATKAEIDKAVNEAHQAFQVSKTSSQAQRAALLEHCATEIEALGDILLETADLETGLGLPRLTGERGRTTGQLRKFAQYVREGSYVEAIIDTALPERQPLPRPDLRRMLIPLGPVAVFTPNNFPLAFGVAGGDSASALAAACPIIVKAHPSYPATCDLVAQAINKAVAKAGFPAGTFSMLQGTQIEVGQALVTHPELEAIAFTGSLRGGRAIADSAAARPKPIPVYAEMGSVNPVILLPEAVRQRAQSIAEGLAASITLGSGQFCTNPGLIFMLQSPETEAFVQTLSQQLEAKTAGTLLNQGVHDGLVQGLGHTAAKASVTTLAGGQSLEREDICFANTLLRVSGSDFIQDPELQEEHFGPVSMVVVFADTEELVQAITNLQGNLTASIHSEASEQENTARLLNLLQDKAGRLLLNGYPTGVEVAYGMQHGGPYPASSAVTTTSVGMSAVKRFLRPIAYQDVPDALLPSALKNSNPDGILRMVDENYSREPIS